MKKIIITIVILSLYVLFPTISFAEDIDTTPTPSATLKPTLKAPSRDIMPKINPEERLKRNENLIEKKKEILADKMEKICTVATVRIDAKLKEYENKKDVEFPRIEKILATLKARLTPLKEKGADTTKLEADIKSLEEKLTKAKADYAAFIAKLKDTKNYTCGKSEGDFLKALQASNIAHRTFIASIKDMRKQLRIGILGDLQAIKSKGVK